MNRNILLLTIRSMNDLPQIERWLLRDHFTESIMNNGPNWARYISYRVVPPPPEMYAEVEKFGYYNWRVTEHYLYDWLAPPIGTTSYIFIPDYNEILGIPPDEAHYPARWYGKAKGPHPPVLTGAPLVPDQDFKGKELSLNGHKSILRWYIAIKYPEGVSVEEGDDWYLNVHAKEVLQQPGLTRYFTSRTVQRPLRLTPWHRIAEQWYEDFNGWRKSVIESPLKYTRPRWAKYKEYPFLEPYVDFVSTFVLECPTNDNLRDNLAYITV